jgi:hypothetical protein
MNNNDTNENGLQRYTGIKKYGKKGFEALQKAGRDGASEEEKGAIKDKYLKKKTNEGLGELADMAERDHEVQMARSELYKIAKYAIKLHDMLKGVSEAEGIEGWQQAKITKASDYISSVYHALDYDMKFEQNAVPESARIQRHKPVLSDSEFKSYKGRLASKLEEKAVSQAQQQAAGIALAAKRKGEKPAGKGAAASMAKMSTKELEKYAGTKHKGLPKKKD